MNRLKNIGMLLLLIFVIYIMFYSNLSYSCLIKENFGISCPSCGMTRAIYQIREFNFLAAFNYNILSVPIFIAVVFSVILIIADIIEDKVRFFKTLNNFLGKYYFAILLALAISMIINNIKYN